MDLVLVGDYFVETEFGKFNDRCAQFIYLYSLQN